MTSAHFTDHKPVAESVSKLENDFTNSTSFVKGTFCFQVQAP